MENLSNLQASPNLEPIVRDQKGLDLAVTRPDSDIPTESFKTVDKEVQEVVTNEDIDTSKSVKSTGTETVSTRDSHSSELYYEVIKLLDSGKHVEAKTLFLDHSSLMIRGGDMDILESRLTSSSIRQCVKRYCSLFDPDDLSNGQLSASAVEELKTTLLNDLLAVIKHFYDSHVSNENYELLLSNTHFLVKRVVFNMVVNHLVNVLDQRLSLQLGYSEFKHVTGGRDGYSNFVEDLCTRTFGQFVDDDDVEESSSGKALFEGEPHRTINELTTALFQPGSSRGLDTAKLSEFIKRHAPEQLTKWTDTYLKEHELGLVTHLDQVDGKDSGEEPELQGPWDREKAMGSISSKDLTEDANDRDYDDGYIQEAGNDNDFFEWYEKGITHGLITHGLDSCDGETLAAKSAAKLTKMARCNDGEVDDEDGDDNDDDNDGDDNDDDDDDDGPRNRKAKRFRPDDGLPRPSSILHRSTSQSPPESLHGTKKIPWTEEEVCALLDGLKKYFKSPQKWRAIKAADLDNDNILAKRSNMDLKDKFVNLRNSGKYDFTSIGSYINAIPRKRKSDVR